MATVQLEHVRKVYEGGFEAVDAFNLAIKDREFVVLVGPSGCGKSTTLRMIAGLEEITSGTIRSAAVVNDVAPKDRDIAMVFQNYALYPHMTVYENMAFALKLRKLPKPAIDQKVQRAAEMLGIEAPRSSAGPRRSPAGSASASRVGRAIVREPQCFLFDEPLSNLDAKLRVEMRAEIKRAPPGAQQHHRLRHARPGRGDDARRSRRGDEGRLHPAVRERRSRSTSARRTVSSPASSARRR